MNSERRWNKRRHAVVVDDVIIQETTSSEAVGQSTRSAAAAADVGNGDDDVSLSAQLRTRCEQLDQKCDMYKHEVNRLNGKLQRFIHEVTDSFLLHALWNYIISIRWTSIPSLRARYDKL